MDNHAAFHIANDSVGKYRPSMTNNFRVTIWGLEGTADKVSEEEDATLGEDTGLVLKISNDSFVEPSFSQQSVTIKRGNLSIEFPSQMDAFSSTANFTCFVDADTYGKLYTWKCLSGDHETGEVGDPSDYWKTVTIDHITGKGELIGTWTLNNCWISNLQGVTFDQSGSSVKTCQVTLKYFKPTYRKA